MRSGADQKRKKNKRLDVHKKHYDNPFISKRKKKKGKFKTVPIKYKLILLLVILLIGGSIWFFGYCSVWNIHNIKVKGSERATPKTIKEVVQTHTKNSHLFPSNNLILVDKNKIRSRIKENFRIKKLDIEKEWPDTLSVHIKEHPYAFIWQENGNYHYADPEGFIIKRVKKEDEKFDAKKDLPLIHNKKDSKVKNDRIVVDPSLTDFIFDLHREFDSKYKDMQPEKIVIPNEAKTVKLLLQKGASLYFDTGEELKEQIEYLLVIKNKKIEGDFKDKQYIDLRYQNKIYYQ